MSKVENHVLVADVGGTHTGVAIFAYHGRDRYEPVCHKTFPTGRIASIPLFMGRFLRKEGRGLEPAVGSVCIDAAGPLGPDRRRASLTNQPQTFTSDEVREATGVEQMFLLNDFEAIGYGLEVLIANQPEAFVRLSRAGRLPPRSGPKPTVLVMGAGTGLGTTVLIYDASTRRYRPIPGEGGHVDFVAIEEIEFKIGQWIRRHRNTSVANPLNRERVVSGPGLANVHEALCNLEPDLGRPEMRRLILKAAPSERPALVAGNAGKDPLCRKALDTWIRCYARAAKNSAIFPLTPGGVFLAGGIAAKILPEMKSGVFMKEFLRCDIPNIQAILPRIPVFVVTDYRIGLFGCANVAANALV